MLDNKRILAVVPARRGSRGIPHKNMQRVGGMSLIGWAGTALNQLSFLDANVLSTDSTDYAEEGRRHGLDAPFVRPSDLSTDTAGSIEVVRHALRASETHYATRFEIILIIEPTSPLRLPEDIERTARRLIDTGADSVVTVSPLSTKSHPFKLLCLKRGRLTFAFEEGRQVTQRQQLTGGLFWRNGVCYALTRACAMGSHGLLTARTVPEIITRPIVNIDEPIDLECAEILLARERSSDLVAMPGVA